MDSKSLATLAFEYWGNKDQPGTSRNMQEPLLLLLLHRHGSTLQNINSCEELNKKLFVGVLLSLAQHFPKPYWPYWPCRQVGK
jgi:hypothetical protein